MEVSFKALTCELKLAIYSSCLAIANAWFLIDSSSRIPLLDRWFDFFLKRIRAIWLPIAECINAFTAAMFSEPALLSFHSLSYLQETRTQLHFDKARGHFHLKTDFIVLHYKLRHIAWFRKEGSKTTKKKRDMELLLWDSGQRIKFSRWTWILIQSQRIMIENI